MVVAAFCVAGFAVAQQTSEPRAEALEAAGDAVVVTARPGGAPVDRRPTGAPVTISFAGDVHAEGGAGAALRAGLPSIRSVLGKADLTIVNLEMAITESGTAAAKQYTFRAPASSLSALRESGVDVVTMANNHGLDYGVDGLRDSLAAAKSTGLPTVGIGLDEDQAYSPHLATVRGQRIAVLGATQVLDSALENAWTAEAGTPGLASAKREQRLLDEVARVRRQADTVVVYLHWGRELDACPLARQESLARKLVDAGADIVVGAHAHVLLGGGYLDGAYVDYGLGNFVFNTKGGEAAKTGLLSLTAQGRSVTNKQWDPALIRAGTPYPLTGEAAERARSEKEGSRGCTGLSPSP